MLTSLRIPIYRDEAIRQKFFVRLLRFARNDESKTRFAPDIFLKREVVISGLTIFFKFQNSDMNF